jgi:hypothetical protein
MVGSTLAFKYQTRVEENAMTNAKAYCDTATIFPRRKFYSTGAEIIKLFKAKFMQLAAHLPMILTEVILIAT